MCSHREIPQTNAALVKRAPTIATSTYAPCKKKKMRSVSVEAGKSRVFIPSFLSSLPASVHGGAEPLGRCPFVSVLDCKNPLDGVEPFLPCSQDAGRMPESLLFLDLSKKETKTYDSGIDGRSICELWCTGAQSMTIKTRHNFSDCVLLCNAGNKWYLLSLTMAEQ